MMVNEFSHRTYACPATITANNTKSCLCSIDTPLASQCLIAGTGVLEQYGYATHKMGEWLGIMIGIIVVLRLLGWLVNVLKRG